MHRLHASALRTATTHRRQRRGGGAHGAPQSHLQRGRIRGPGRGSWAGQRPPQRSAARVRLPQARPRAARRCCQARGQVASAACCPAAAYRGGCGCTVWPRAAPLGWALGMPAPLPGQGCQCKRREGCATWRALGSAQCLWQGRGGEAGGCVYDSRRAGIHDGSCPHVQARWSTRHIISSLLKPILARVRWAKPRTFQDIGLGPCPVSLGHLHAPVRQPIDAQRKAVQQV